MSLHTSSRQIVRYDATFKAESKIIAQPIGSKRLSVSSCLLTCTGKPVSLYPELCLLSPCEKHCGGDHVCAGAHGESLCVPVPVAAESHATIVQAVGPVLKHRAKQFGDVGCPVGVCTDSIR